jgi:hypothetical protein
VTAISLDFASDSSLHAMRGWGFGFGSGSVFFL